jgi:hypothetical protein
MEGGDIEIKEISIDSDFDFYYFGGKIHLLGFLENLIYRGVDDKPLRQILT